MAFQIIADLYRLIRIDIAVPGKTKVSQCIAAHISVIDRENQPSVIAESGITLYLGNSGVLCIDSSRSCIGNHLIIIRIPKKQRQRIVQIFLYGIKVVIAAILQMEHIMLRCKHI